MDKAILVYTISDNELRRDFADILLDRGWKEHDDQTTLTIPQYYNEVFSILTFEMWFNLWKKGRKWSKGDFIQIYFPMILKKSNRDLYPSLNSRKYSV